MSVLDTFYILFKSNAKEAIKGNEEVEKSTKKTEKALSESDKAAKDLGESFVKLVEQAATTAAGVVSVWAVANKLFDTAKFNSSLNIQGKVLSQNTSDILAYGAAVEATGGSVQEFQGYLQTVTQQAANAGLKLGPLSEFFKHLRERIDGLSDNEKLRVLDLAGVPQGMRALLMSSNEEFARSIELAEKYAKATQADTDVARAFGQQWTLVGQSFTTTATKVGSDLLPSFTALSEILTNIGEWLTENRPFIYGFVVGLTGLMGALAVASLAAFAPFLAMAGIIAAAATGLGFMALGVAKIAEGLGLIKSNTKGSPSGATAASVGSGTAAESMAFWMAQGFTRAQASGIVANEQRESSFNPSQHHLDSDGKIHYGSFQWSPERRQSILSGLGIDVANASHANQLKAALWEMQQSGIDSRIRATTSPESSAAAFSRYFERPGNGPSEEALRAQMARGHFNAGTAEDVAQARSQIAVASSSPFSSSAPGATYNQGGAKSLAITTGPITVNTQATDANGIASALDSAIHARFRDTASNYDDGVQN